MTNDLIKLLDEFPDMPWEWDDVSDNINITPEYRKTHKILKQYKLSTEDQSVNITEENKNKHFDDWLTADKIFNNPEKVIKYIRSNLNYPWIWTTLSMSPSITHKIVMENLDLPWDWRNLSYYATVNYSSIKSNIGKWMHSYLSWNPSITFNDVKSDLNAPWDWYGISRIISTTYKDVIENPTMPWDWTFLSRNSSITYKDVLSDPTKLWNWNLLSCNPSITYRDVLSDPTKPWNWGNLSINPSITYEDVKSNPNAPWAWHILSANEFKMNKEYKKVVQRRQTAKINLRVILARSTKHFLVLKLIYIHVMRYYNIKDTIINNLYLEITLKK